MNSRFEFISFRKSWENAGAPRFRGVFHFGPVWGGLNWRAAPSGVGFVFLRWHHAIFPHLIFPSLPCKNKYFCKNYMLKKLFRRLFFEKLEIIFIKLKVFLSFYGWVFKIASFLCLRSLQGNAVIQADLVGIS